MNDHLLVCAECGNSDLHVTRWVHLNSGHILQQEPPTSQIWCTRCETDAAEVTAAGVLTRAAHDIARTYLKGRYRMLCDRGDIPETSTVTEEIYLDANMQHKVDSILTGLLPGWARLPDDEVYRLARVTCEEYIPEGYDEDMQESSPHDRDVS